MYQITRTSPTQWSDEAWDGLAGSWPFLRSPWMLTWWKVFGAEDRAYTLAAQDEQGRLCGLLPLCRSEQSPQTLGFMTSGDACTDRLTILCHPEQSQSVATAMARWLAENVNHHEHRWRQLDLDGIAAGDQAMVHLANQLQTLGMWTHAESRCNHWFLDTSVGDFSSYLAARSKTNRRLWRSEVQRVDDGELTYRQSSSEQELLDDLNELIQLHQTRWTSVGQTGSFADPLFRKFIKLAAAEFLMKGRLRMNVLLLKSEPIAAQIELIGDDGTICNYSAGMSLEHPELQPGRTLNLLSIRHAFEQHSPGIDFLRGDEPYKERFHATATPIARLRVFSNTMRGSVQATTFKGWFGLKQWKRRHDGNAPALVLPNLSLPSPSTAVAF